MTRIYPSQIKDPRDLKEIRRMIHSWADVPVDKRPRDVQAFRFMDRLLCQVGLDLYEAKLQNQALANEYDKLVKLADGFRQNVWQRSGSVANRIENRDLTPALPDGSAED